MLRLAHRDAAAFAALLVAPGVALPVALFHAQQAVEKPLEAVMCLRGLGYPRTHDLEELAARLADAGCTPAIGEAGLNRLTPYAVEYRYDDEAPELLTGAAAQSIVESSLAWAQVQITAGWP